MSPFTVHYEALISDRPGTESLMRARLLAAVQREGHSLVALAAITGHAGNHWTRKLGRGADRGLGFGDVDLLCSALHIDAADLWHLVALPGDVALLAEIERRTEYGPDGDPIQGAHAADLIAAAADPDATACALARLHAQDAIALRRWATDGRAFPRPYLALRPLGVRALHDPLLRTH